jgi:hypothetical protein
MAQSVLKKRDRILRRRRILTASIGTAAGITAVAAALAVTFNLNRPRGVDLIDPGTVSQPSGPDISDLSPVNGSSVEVPPEYPYNDVEIREDSGTGSPDSYESLMEQLQVYSGNMNLFEFTITEQYTPEEAVELTGTDIFSSSSTLFSAHISYDYLSGSKKNMDILLAQAGTAESQVKNYPLYGVGKTYIAFLSGFNKDSWNVACPELVFFLNSGICTHIKAEQIKFVTSDGVQLGKEIPEDMQYLYTTTSNNPVRYVREYDITELSDFLRSDWISRKLYSETAPQGYTDFASADIPDITPEDRGLQAMGTRNVLLDTKQAGAFSVLLVGDYVTTDNAGHSGMISCFDFGVQIYDGNTVSNLAGAHSGAGAGDYWIYTDRFSDYMDVFQFGDNYIIALRYYDTDGARYTIFIAIKDGTFYPELIGDYSAVTGVQLDVTTWLSKNYSVDVDSCTITDNDSGISYVFDFDAISDTFTRPHYTAVKSASNEAVSDRLAEMWLNKWTEITASMDLLLPKVSVFGFELSDGSRLVAFVYPNYKSYGAVFYRISGSDITELGNETCGSDFELLENSSGQYLHTTIRFAGGVMNADSIYVDDSYYLITESSLDPVLRVGKELYNEEAVYWSVYENEESVSVTAEEYENLINSALPECAVVSAVSLDKDGDYKIDDSCAFEDDTDGLKTAILSAL